MGLFNDVCTYTHIYIFICVYTYVNIYLLYNYVIISQKLMAL